jgi:hypothetical protein
MNSDSDSEYFILTVSDSDTDSENLAIVTSDTDTDSVGVGVTVGVRCHRRALAVRDNSTYRSTGRYFD